MSSLLLSTLTASSTQEKLYVDDVFSTYLYTGNGSTQTINNGIDLSGKGGLVWIKARNQIYDNVLCDSARGKSSTYYKWLISNKTDAEVGAGASQGVTDFLSTGFSVGMSNGAYFNGSSTTYASWTFRRSERFFDVVTYTGDGVAGRQIAHSLGVAPGMIIVKRTDSTGDWNVFHTSLGAGGLLVLNTTEAAQTGNMQWFPTLPTASSYSPGPQLNVLGATYIAYLFAHDPSAEGIIQCGGYYDNGSGTTKVSVGFEPQFVIAKRADGTSDWVMYDFQRGFSHSTDNIMLSSNSATAETSNLSLSEPTATGFTSSGFSAGTYIYIAVRRPNKPPSSGAEVFDIGRNQNRNASIGESYPYLAQITGLKGVDLAILKGTSNSPKKTFFQSRLTGPFRFLDATSTNLEKTDTTSVASFTRQSGDAGIPIGSLSFEVALNAWSGYFFRRAPGFMDVVCYTQVAGGNVTVSHSLGVLPEMIFTKERDGTRAWDTYHKSWPNHYLRLNEASALYSGTNFTDISATQFRHFATNGKSYVAYLFASLPGISKVGSYTGNGSTQTIDCGFGTGARFFLVKATSTTGSWWIFDSARGIVSSFDPALQLNSTAAEITSADAVDPTSVGIIVNQEATCSINATGVSYIFLAIA